MKTKLIDIPAVIFLLALCMPSMSLGNRNENSQKKNDPPQKDTIHVVGHAHMDMNWLWTYSETMKMCNDNLRQTVSFMEEFPDFTMLQSQAAVYNFVEKVDPALFELVKKYVKQGRLELAGGMWTEGDTGSAINEANKEAVARYTEVLRKSTELRDNAFRKMADEVKFQKGMGQPVVAFNLQPKVRSTIVEASVYSHEAPVSVQPNNWGNPYGSKNINLIDKSQGKAPTVLVRDASGKTYPAQIVWAKVTPPGFTSKVRFITDDIPAGGYKTFYVDMTRPGEQNEAIPFHDNTFETDFFRVKFDMKTGGIVSLYDKRSNKEYVRDGEQLNKLRVYLEDKKGGMKSWTINKIVGEEDVTNIKSVKVVEKGPVRACIETVKTWENQVLRNAPVFIVLIPGSSTTWKYTGLKQGAIRPILLC